MPSAVRGGKNSNENTGRLRSRMSLIRMAADGRAAGLEAAAHRTADGQLCPPERACWWAGILPTQPALPGRHGAIAQLGERLDRTQEVGGSSPPSSISLVSCL